MRGTHYKLLLLMLLLLMLLLLLLMLLWFSSDLANVTFMSYLNEFYHHCQLHESLHKL